MYTAVRVTENQAEKSRERRPPTKLMRKVCPKPRATSMVVCSMSTLKGMRGIQVMKQMRVKTAKMRKTTPAIQ